MKAIQAYEKGDKKTAVALVYNEAYKTGLDEISKHGKNFQEEMNSSYDKVVNRMNTLVYIFEILAMIFISFSIFILLKTSNIISNKVIKPVLMIKNQISTLAEGDLQTSYDLQIDENEIGELAEASIEIRENLTTYITGSAAMSRPQAGKDINLTGAASSGSIRFTGLGSGSDFDSMITKLIEKEKLRTKRLQIWRSK